MPEGGRRGASGGSLRSSPTAFAPPFRPQHPLRRPAPQTPRRPSQRCSMHDQVLELALPVLGRWARCTRCCMLWYFARCMPCTLHPVAWARLRPASPCTSSRMQRDAVDNTPPAPGASAGPPGLRRRRGDTTPSTPSTPSTPGSSSPRAAAACLRPLTALARTVAPAAGVPLPRGGVLRAGRGLRHAAAGTGALRAAAAAGVDDGVQAAVRNRVAGRGGAAGPPCGDGERGGGGAPPGPPPALGFGSQISV